MKKTLYLISCCLFFISCGLSPTTPVIPSDPDGTVTANLSTTEDWVMYQGLADKMYVFTIEPRFIVPDHTVNYPYITVGIAMTNILNMHFNIICYAGIDRVNPDPPNGVKYPTFTGVEVANMGICDGLGDVTTKPSSGYSDVSSIQDKHGYVLRFRKSYDQADTTLPYTYARFYVVNWLTSNGGVVGATIKIQLPF